MMRCPQCGQRIRDALALCPIHGALERPPDPSPTEALSPSPERELEALGYRTTRLLGRGGFGSVFAAERVRDGKLLALKVSIPGRADTQESLRREARALRAVGPPHVPELYEVGRAADLVYLAMERIEAPTLAERMLALSGPAPLDVFGRLADGILTALEAVHQAGLVHRDLKPENIFIEETGAARLIDFGLARQLGAGAHEPLESTAGIDDVGTAEYMSPEQCDGLPAAERSSDVYSLGVLFYELLSGAPPFWGRAADVREAHRSQRPAPLAQRVPCPPELDRLVRRCLAKDSRQRFPDLAALRDALVGSLSARVQSLKPPQPSNAPRRPASPPVAAREQRAMGLVFFEASAGVGAVQSVVRAAGGQIVHTDGLRYVAAFGHDVGDNPARVALLAAHRLLGAKLTERLLVDVATVSVQHRRDGSRRIFSAILTNSDRYPVPADPLGVMITGASCEVLPDVEAQPLVGQFDRFALALPTGATELTTLGSQLAPLIGRDDVLSCLLESERSARTQVRPTLFTVLAAQGYGRTHLASTVAHELGAKQPQVEVIRLTAQEGMLSAATPLLPELLRRLLDLPLEAPQPTAAKTLLQERLAGAGEGVWAGAALALGWIDAEHAEARRLISAPGTLRLATARAAGEALRRRAEQRPVALLLDDAQLADEPTLDALEYATLKDHPVRLWVCVLARPSFAGSRPGWGSRAGQSQKLVLGELARKDAVELARRLLLPAVYIPEAVLLRLAERTQGVPRLLVELARGLKREGFVRRTERGSSYYLAIDELDKLADLPIVQWNTIREIEALPPQLSGHARLASVLGGKFSSAELEALLSALERDAIPDDMQLDASVGIQRLIDSGILRRQRGGTVDFRHALLRDTLYQMTPEAQRTRLHRAAFEAYRSLDLPDDQRLPRLAMHAARSGERETAAATYLVLARRFARVQAYLEAEAAYGSAIECLPESDERRIQAGRGRGLMRSRLGRQDGALEDLRESRELAHALGAHEREIELMLDEATVLDWMREASQSGVLVRAVEAMGVPQSPLLRARLAMNVARNHHRRGEAEASLRVGSEAVELARALGDEGYETRIVAQLMVATDCANLGHLDQAARGFAEMIAEAESRGDLWHVAAALGNRALLWHGLHDFERLIADLARAIQVGREIGEPSIEFIASYNLSESEYSLGRLAPARERAQRCFELANQLFGENNREVSVSQLLLARIALYDGDPASAQRLTVEIRARIARARAAGESDAELETSMQLLLEMVALAIEDAPLVAWQALVSRAKQLELQSLEEVELLERAALAAVQLGALAEGRAFYEQALDVSRRKPNLMSDRVVKRLAPVFASLSR